MEMEYLVHVWYPGKFAKITVGRRDFAKAIDTKHALNS